MKLVLHFWKNPGEQQVVVGGLKSGKINRKSWLDKERDVDVFDIKSDVIKTLIELGIEEKNLLWAKIQNTVIIQVDQDR